MAFVEIVAGSVQGLRAQAVSRRRSRQVWTDAQRWLGILFLFGQQGFRRDDSLCYGRVTGR